MPPKPVPRKPHYDFVEAAMPKGATRKFLLKFYEHGKGRGWFPEKPAGIKPEQLGKWLRKNKRLPDSELHEEMREWVKSYAGLEEVQKEMARLVREEPEKAPRFRRYLELREVGWLPAPKTLARFEQTHHADCVAMSTALGEMAAEMEYSVQYYKAKDGDTDLSTLAGEGRQIAEQERSGHSYVAIDGVQHDPAVGLSNTAHRGTPETRKERAAAIWSNHGNMLSKIEEHVKALRAHDIAVELDPNRAAAWTNRGAALRALGRHADALVSHDKALGLDPNLAAAWSNRGAALHELGRHEDALESVRKALALTPDGHPNRRIMQGLERDIKERLRDKLLH